MDHTYKQESLDFERIESVIQFIEQNFREQPELKNIADHVGLSEFLRAGSALAQNDFCSIVPKNMQKHF